MTQTPNDQDDLNEFFSGEKSRQQKVIDRANAEKKSYGFLRSLKKKVFGKKEAEPAPEIKKPEKTYQDRLRDITNRAKNQ